MEKTRNARKSAHSRSAADNQTTAAMRARTRKGPKSLGKSSIPKGAAVESRPASERRNQGPIGAAVDGLLARTNERDSKGRFVRENTGRLGGLAHSTQLWAALEPLKHDKQMIVRRTSDEIDLNNHGNTIRIAVTTASYKLPRGFTCVAFIGDESAFWEGGDSANPDMEIWRAVLPSLATTNGPAIIISTPYAGSGLAFEPFDKHYGHDSDTLVWTADTLTMNGLIDPAIVACAYEDDPEAAAPNGPSSMLVHTSSGLSSTTAPNKSSTSSRCVRANYSRDCSASPRRPDFPCASVERESLLCRPNPAREPSPSSLNGDVRNGCPALRARRLTNAPWSCSNYDGADHSSFARGPGSERQPVPGCGIADTSRWLLMWWFRFEGGVWGHSSRITVSARRFIRRASMNWRPRGSGQSH